MITMKSLSFRSWFVWIECAGIGNHCSANSKAALFLNQNRFCIFFVWANSRNNNKKYVNQDQEIFDTTVLFITLI